MSAERARSTAAAIPDRSAERASQPRAEEIRAPGSSSRSASSSGVTGSAVSDPG
jgi:hypothetical protein